MQTGAVMMNAYEAIKGLDGYAEALLSLNTLLSLYEEKSDEHQSLLLQIKQKQTDGRWVASAIMKDIHEADTKSDRSGGFAGISAAMKRYVAADEQVSEALLKAQNAAKPNKVSEAIERFRLKQRRVSE
jgi:hypothetical protein